MIRKERYIHSRSGNRQIQDLLQAIFITELTFPSKRLWIISPWITDIPVIDNRANQFLTLEPDWANRWVRLSEVLIKIIARGTLVRIATRPDNHNFSFTDKMKQLSKAIDDETLLKIYHKAELHEKGILGETYYLCGSMNFTISGISFNEEALHFHIDSTIVAENKIVIERRWEVEE